VSVVIFAGPTLDEVSVRSHIDALCFPPASGGDLYRSALARPLAIGLIDGSFGHTPAVWHKEILWAIGEGIRVFGSAGVGALRAAELAPFGMEGVGKIYESFCAGTLEDDDEVALEYGGPEDGYRPRSEAMVNIRATVDKSVRQGILSASNGSVLLDVAKGLFYPQRSYQTILQQAVELKLSASEVGQFRDWLPRGRVNQMRQDAVAMLRQIRLQLERGSPLSPALFKLEQTEIWRRIQSQNQ
jgi:hypothetical protein